jgi:hypothetical protein
MLIIPTLEIFGKNSTLGYFDGEENILERWKELEKRNEKD